MKLYKNYLSLLIMCAFILNCTNKTSNNETVESTAKEEMEQVEEEQVPVQQLNADQQIAAALLAAPEETRGGAKVYGYDEDGALKTLKEGTNEMICIADDPNKKGFEVVSYHNELEPYMARGRALKEEGKSFVERRDMREKEAQEGKLKMPGKPSTLHILHGEKGWYDTDSLKVRNAKYRYVVYIPFATQASTGLSLKPNAPGHPWLMFPGKANAHIMITPPLVETN